MNSIAVNIILITGGAVITSLLAMIVFYIQRAQKHADIRWNNMELKVQSVSEQLIKVSYQYSQLLDKVSVTANELSNTVGEVSEIRKYLFNSTNKKY